MSFIENGFLKAIIVVLTELVFFLILLFKDPFISGAHRKQMLALTGLFFALVILDISVFLSGPETAVGIILTVIEDVIRLFIPISYFIWETRDKWKEIAFVTLLLTLAFILDLTVFKRDAIDLYTIIAVNTGLAYYVQKHFSVVKDYNRALEEGQRFQIALSQIQPHFIYNTLSTIQALIRIDPDKAFVTLEKFGNYLRINLKSLKMRDRIPFKREIEHTEVYVQIEMVRFPRIRVEYDIEDDDFSLPALTIQPMVENAIRHGVRVRNDGVVRIETRREKDGHRLIVRDNGKGFDTSVLDTQGDEHIGIRTVRNRLRSMCDGSLKIESYPDKGTVVDIFIPLSRADFMKKA